MSYRKEEGPDSNGNLPFLGSEQFLPHFCKISQHTLLLEIKFHPFFLGLLRPWKRFQRTVVVSETHVVAKASRDRRALIV